MQVTSVTFECIGGVRSDDPVMLAVGSKNGHSQSVSIHAYPSHYPSQAVPGRDRAWTYR